MRRTRGAFALLLCLVLLLCLAPLAWAEDGTAYEARSYEKDVIVGFKDVDSPLTVDTDYKYALIELEKEFPTSLTVYMGGTVFYTRVEGGMLSLHHVDGAVTRDIDVSWKCVEDYDEDLDVFHFVPALSEENLADGVELPVLTVNVLGRIERPLMPEIEEDMGPFLQDADMFYAEEGVSESALPASYNNYENGNLPPVRDQGNYGTCWAFATIAAVEADLIHDGVFDTRIDLSELHLAYFNYHIFYDEKGCNIGDNIFLNGADYLNAGGAPLYAALDLANLIGPVQEADVPYSLAGSYSPEIDDGRIGSMQVSNVYAYSPKDIAAVKQAVIDHGALAVAYNDASKNYSATHNTYYYPPQADPIKTNHIVAIVGWDDNISKDSFRSGAPEGNGAWLIRNSWGVNGYNHSGYFWLSYYDKSLGRSAYALDVKPSRYQHVYAYDNLPPIWYWTVSGGSAIEQNFQVDAGEVIEAIGVYCETAGANLAFTVTCGNISAEASLTVGAPGYYVVPLSKPISIIENSEVNVQYIITGSGSVRVNAEGPSTYSPTINKIEYHILYDSQCGSGLIVNGDLKEKDARIKLFTNDMTENIEPDFILPDDLREIGEEAFSGTFTYAKLPDRPVAIGRRAFANCPNLAFILIPPQVTDISPYAFEGLSNLTILGVDGSAADRYAREYGISFMAILDEGSTDDVLDTNG